MMVTVTMLLVVWWFGYVLGANGESQLRDNDTLPWWVAAPVVPITVGTAAVAAFWLAVGLVTLFVG